MKFDSIRSSLIGSVFVALASLLLGSCGGGGAGSPGPVGGPPQIQPNTGTLYAGVEYTFTVGGGRPPYFLSSSEPSVLPVPQRIDGNFFTVIPANTAVVDTGLPPNSLPVRTVILQMRDAIGSTASTQGLQVAQNFLTGYGVFYTSNCTVASSGGAPAACAGGETAVEVTAAINGNLYGNREYRFEIVRGPFYFVDIVGSGTLGPGGSTWTTRTDHEGDAHAIFRVNSNVGTQIGIFRVVDVETGASTTHVINIQGVPVSGELEAIPSDFTFTGPNTAQCGTGSADFLVFDGTPPYTVVSSFNSILITPGTSNDQPGRFTLTATNPFTCITDGTVIIRDANNNRTTVTVTTEPGSDPPPPAPILLTPGSITLACGVGGSIAITGGPTGTATFNVTSPDARITATASGRTLTVTRVAVDPAGTPVSPTPGIPNLINYSVVVTDGTNITTLNVRAPSNCPP